MRIFDRVGEIGESPGRLWLFVILYTILAGIIIQMILLPHVITKWHAGDGLFKGLDGPKFNRLAMQQYEAITDRGWKAWEAAPGDQFVSGVASAAYVLIYPKPWALLPLNAALNATAAVCVVLMLRHVTGSRRQATLAALPFILFPSSLLWNTQLHNEVYAVPGVCMLLLGWSGLVGSTAEAGRLHRWRSILLIGAGSLLVAAVRIYVVAILLGLFLFGSLSTTLVEAFAQTRTRSGRHALLVQTGTVAFAGLMMAGAISVAYGMTQDTAPLQQLVEEVSGEAHTLSQSLAADRSTWWQPSARLPSIVDNRFRDLARIRRFYTGAWAHSGSMIDVDVELNSATELLGYLPRAIQISMFTPFPSIWFTVGRKATGAAFRALVVPETALAYACLLGLPYAIWARRRTAALWVVLMACAGMLAIYGLVAPNQGTIFRLRFPYFLALVCLGLWGWLELARSRRGSPDPSE